MKSDALTDLDVERRSDNEVVFELIEPPLWGPPSAKKLPNQNDFVEMMRAAVAGQQRLSTCCRLPEVNRALMDFSFLPKVKRLKKDNATILNSEALALNLPRFFY